MNLYYIIYRKQNKYSELDDDKAVYIKDAISWKREKLLEESWEIMRMKKITIAETVAAGSHEITSKVIVLLIEENSRTWIIQL